MQLQYWLNFWSVPTLNRNLSLLHQLVANFVLGLSYLDSIQWFYQRAYCRSWKQCWHKWINSKFGGWRTKKKWAERLCRTEGRSQVIILGGFDYTTNTFQIPLMKFHPMMKQRVDLCSFKLYHFVVIYIYIYSFFFPFKHNEQHVKGAFLRLNCSVGVHIWK